MVVSVELQEAVRTLLLPISEDRFHAACAAVAVVLDVEEIGPSDVAPAFSILHERWRNEDGPSGLLIDIVRAALGCEPQLPESFTTTFFRIHQALVAKHLLSFEDARGLLSHTLFITSLLRTERMSCAQIAITLSARRGDLQYSWQQVQLISRALALTPRLNTAACQRLAERDSRLEELRFADATPREAIDVISARASALGYPGDIGPVLAGFYDPSAAPRFEPAYSIILHANAMAAEFFDHPPMEAAYEFEPRGGAIAWIQRALHRSYEASESAYLNNSKGAYAFDSNWAWGRKSGKWKSAHSLSELLGGLGSMPYAGRRELCGWIRQWLLRMERERAGSVIAVPHASSGEAVKFLESMASANTETSGVLDQRVLDFVCPLEHKPADGWRARGLGDHVNASNLSRRKLGDIEFERIGAHQIVAYEAHGGALTEVYVEGHRLSLSRVLELRKEELLELAPSSEWQIKIVFVAHYLRTGIPPVERIAGFEVSWELRTYEELVQENAVAYLAAENALEKFNSSVVDPISLPHVPDAVRTRFLSLCV